MATKTVALDREAYEALRRRKREGETFSDVVKRTVGRRRSILEFAGIWKDMPEKDLAKVRAFMEEGRQRDRERMERILSEEG